MKDTEIEKLKSAYSLLPSDDTAGAEILFHLIQGLEKQASAEYIANLFLFEYTS
jgi:hypothetical protein